MVAQENLTGETSLSWGKIVLTSVWDEQDRTRQTNPFTDERWGISNEILPITVPTGELVPSIDEEVPQEESLSVIHFERPQKVQRISQPFRNYKRNKILRQAIDYLQEFRESLHTPEAPMYVHLAKRKLQESWEFITEEDREVRLALSALEGALRQQKWRNYKPHQIATLQTILEECIDGKLRNPKDVLKKISTLYKQDIDIFPSAPEEAYEEDDETDVVS
ncbi:TPA: hypothetical protein EYP66_05695 [Candidatus Poribacteria bacterium]|nr:hypothetical protein [Candidatus Poribacteria bacterium]